MSDISTGDDVSIGLYRANIPGTLSQINPDKFEGLEAVDLTQKEPPQRNVPSVPPATVPSPHPPPTTADNQADTVEQFAPLQQDIHGNTVQVLRPVLREESDKNT